MNELFGLGLRTSHYEALMHRQEADVQWLEILSENYFVEGGQPLVKLDQLRDCYPMTMHGVSMNIGSSNGLSTHYLKQLKRLQERVNPMWISDHLCWTGCHGLQMHDLLPLPFTEEALHIVGRNVQQAQEFLGQTLVLENVSSYLEFTCSEMTEWEFLAELHKRTGCKILLDLNNVYVSATNHGFDARTFIDHIPVNAVAQFHLAGHSQQEDMLIDTHDHPVCEGVWDLYAYALERFGMVHTMIERDDRIPPLHELVLELRRAKAIALEIHEGIPTA